jgi:hypothetical protein
MRWDEMRWDGPCHLCTSVYPKLRCYCDDESRGWAWRSHVEAKIDPTQGEHSHPQTSSTWSSQASNSRIGRPHSFRHQHPEGVHSSLGESPARRNADQIFVKTLTRKPIILDVKAKIQVKEAFSPPWPAAPAWSWSWHVSFEFMNRASWAHCSDERYQMSPWLQSELGSFSRFGGSPLDCKWSRVKWFVDGLERLWAGLHEYIMCVVKVWHSVVGNGMGTSRWIFPRRRKKLSMDNLKSQTLHKLLDWSGVFRLVLNANVEAVLRWQCKGQKKTDVAQSSLSSHPQFYYRKLHHHSIGAVRCPPWLRPLSRSCRHCLSFPC